MFTNDDMLPANYGYGAPGFRIFPVHIPNAKYLKSCGPYATLWKQYQDLLAEWKGLPGVGSGSEAAQIEQEALNVISRMKTEAAKCKQREASGFVGGVGGTAAVGSGRFVSAGGMQTLRAGGAGAGAGVDAMAVSMPAPDAGTGTGTSTTTWLIVGGVGLAAVFLLTRGKKKSGSAFGGSF